MASRMALLITAGIAVLVMGALLLTTVSATAYTSGDDDGWDGDVDYNDWFRGKEFKVGDTLKFVYSTDEESPNDVLQVDVASYETCTVPTDAKMLSFGSGEVNVLFTNARQYFFICGVEDRCDNGMKIALNVE